MSPISCLPPELLGHIFAFIPILTRHSVHSPRQRDCLGWLNAAHVCHQWREVALNQPHFWSYIDFAALTLAGATEMLVRAKEAPLHLEADLSHPEVWWNPERLDTFHMQLEAHASNIRSLNITADPRDLSQVLGRLKSPAPALQSLSLSAREKYRTHPTTPCQIPYALFDRATPKLICLELDGCPIGWSSPFLKGLRHLKLLCRTEEERPNLQTWLDLMGELSQLESLVVHSATPIAPLIIGTMPHVHVVTLPSLTHLHLSASASDCALALAHLLLPTLTWLRVEAGSVRRDCADIRAVIPHFARNAHGSQDTTPLQSVVISGFSTRTDILLWTVPDADMEYHDNNSFTRATLSARAVFSTSNPHWDIPTEATVYGDVLSALPMSSLATLTVLNFAVITRSIWLRCAPQWSLVKRVRLGCMAMRTFIDTLTRDATSEGPLLPSLTELVTTGWPLNMRTIRLRDMLLVRVKQGVPIRTLDLRGYTVPEGAIRMLRGIVPVTRGPMGTKVPVGVVWPAPLADWVDWNV